MNNITMYIDTHAHLNFKSFNSDYVQTLERAFNVGVKRIILPGSNLQTSKRAVEIARTDENIYAAVGLHPIHVKDEKFGSDFEKLAKDKKVVAIGETGLDYYYDRTSSDLQKELFQKHLKLANLLSKPVIIHCRDAYEDVLSILTSQNPLPKGVMHCYLSNWDYAKILIDMGFLIGFTGIITFTKDYELLDAVKNIPLDKILIETDAPYLTPESHRGQRNEPAYVIEVAKKIAEIKKISVEEVAEQTTKNAEELFKI